MKKGYRIMSVAIIILLGYMSATDAIGRWFGLWGAKGLFNLLFICSLPLLIYLATDKNKIKTS